MQDAVSSTGYPDGTIIENAETGSFYFVESDARRLIPSGGHLLNAPIVRVAQDRAV